MEANLRRALDRSAAGEPLDVRDLVAVLSCSDDDLEEVLARARGLRDERSSLLGLDGIVTYSRKVFIPLTRLCRYRCSYCTFVDTRVRGRAYLTVDEVVDIATSGRRRGCTEALFTLGEGPEHRHPEARAWLDDMGYASTVDYLADAARAVLSRTGLLPHANPGAVTVDQMRALREVAPSQGVMMEELSDRLLEPGRAHAGAAGKARAVRLEQLTFAAETSTPFTTGLLIGIGETLAERAATVVDVRDSHTGQIQEVIVQNFRAKSDTPMRDAPDAAEPDMLRTIAAVRLALGTSTAVQAPPNLTPRTYGRYLDAGIDDWGGISPVTPDHVNPEMPWPGLEEVAAVVEQRGFALRQRLPVYPSYLSDDGSFERWVAPGLRRHVLAVSDATGLAREERWYAGEGWTPVLRSAQPRPKRRALAMASGRPDRTAADVSEGAVTQGCGDASGTTPGAGFDEMLPDLVPVTVFDHERADRAGVDDTDSHPWLAPYSSAPGGPARDVAATIAKASGGERPSHAEVVRLLRCEGADLRALVEGADALRASVNGSTVTYVVNRNITYTNLCHTGCGFCGFARPVGHADGYYFDPATVGAKAKQAWELGATEVCVQGGIHPHNDGNVYLEIARAVKDAAPRIHLHGFSPLEVIVGARSLGLELDRYMPMLARAGLDSMPGTAAEILDDRVRPKITPEKLTASDWFEVMRTAHRNGIVSTSTIMFGHVDDPSAWATHLLGLRDLQSETGGFTELVPLPFVHHRSPIFMRGASRTGPTWRECVKMHAVARLVLHPLVTNIQASWVKLGVEGVVAMLDAGCNDFGGTLMEEHISRMAGASHGLGVAVSTIEDAIRGAGRIPRRRATDYSDPEQRVAVGT